MGREPGLLFLFSRVLFLCGSVVSSRDGSRQRVGIFNEVCPHFVLLATGPQASASLLCFALRLLGLHRSLPESASSEAVPLPWQLAGEVKRPGWGQMRDPTPQSGSWGAELQRKGK